MHIEKEESKQHSKSLIPEGTAPLQVRSHMPLADVNSLRESTEKKKFYHLLSINVKMNE